MGEALLKGETAGTLALGPLLARPNGLSIGYQAKTGRSDRSAHSSAP
jgi:hypothetical protein